MGIRPPAGPVLLAVAGILLAAYCGPAVAQKSTGLPAPPEIRADTTFGRLGEWFRLRSLDGNALEWSELESKVLFVNFWASWCRPCLKEMPAIGELAKDLASDEMIFLLVSIDEEVRDVRRFIDKMDLPLNVYQRGWNPGESIFRAGIIPATFIINKEAEVVYQHHGAANWNSDGVRRVLTELAKSQTPAASPSRGS